MLFRAHEGKVWRVLGYESWKEYCVVEFQFSKQRSYQLLDFVEIKQSLTDTSQPGLTPANEKQTRALSKLDPEKRKAAWKQAVELANGNQPKAAQVKQAVEEQLVRRHERQFPLSKIIGKYGINSIHPFLECFPLLSNEEFREFCEDVADHGFLNPIAVTSDGILIDGQIRLEVAEATGVPLKIEQIDPPDILAFIIGRNILRAHYTPDQRTAIAVEASRNLEKKKAAPSDQLPLSSVLPRRMNHKPLATTVKLSRFCESFAWEKGNLNDSTYRAFCKFAGYVFNVRSSREANHLLSEVVALIKGAGDSVKPDKLIEQFSQAFAYVATQRAATSLGMCHLLKTGGKWPQPEPELIESFAQIASLRDWEEISPNTPAPLKPQDILPAVFSEKSLVCYGQKKNIHFIRRLGDSLFRIAERVPFVVPNAAKAPHIKLADGKLSKKCEANFPERRFLIIEFDRKRIDPRENLSLDALLDLQASLHAHLAKEYAPLALLVYSGNQSLHGWYPCAGVDEEQVLEFLRYACRLGADHYLSSKSFFTRMPGGRHENGKQQTIHYFNPEAIL